MSSLILSLLMLAPGAQAQVFDVSGILACVNSSRPFCLCGDSKSAAERICAGQPTSQACREAANHCTTSCAVGNTMRASWTSAERLLADGQVGPPARPGYLSTCNTLLNAAGGTTNSCDALAAQVQAATSMPQAQKQQLQNECTQACSSNAAQLATCQGTARAGADPTIDPASAGGDPEPLDPGADDMGGGDNTVADDGSGGGGTYDETPQTSQDTRMADAWNRQQMLQGMSIASNPNVNLNGVQAGGVNFSGGPSSDGGSGYAGATGMIGAGGGGYGGGGFNPTLNDMAPFDPPFVGGSLQTSGAGGGGGPGGGQPPMMPMGGGGMGMGMGGAGFGGGGRGGAPGRRGATYSSTVEGQVKSMGTSFHAPGGKSGGGGAKRNTAGVAAEPAPGKARYKKKANNDANVALARLFGAPRGAPMGQQPGGNGTSYYGGGGGCLDTVFCSMENFFMRVDRYPNSDIKH